MIDKTGGPAFPCNEIALNGGGTARSSGITTRDYFAAKAMQALIIANGPAPIGGWPTYAEKTSYVIADAMLIAREQS